jgi:VWFA-related protein
MGVHRTPVFIGAYAAHVFDTLLSRHLFENSGRELRMAPVARRFLIAIPLLLAISATGSVADAQAKTAEPALKARPQSAPEAGAGNLHLDVIVTDAAGKPVSGLTAGEFTLLDNKLSQKILSFQTFDDPKKATAQTQVFLVLDTVNSSVINASSMRSGIEKFLRQNGGHLAQPVTLILMTDAGPRVSGHPTQDGNALADVVHAIDATVHTIHSASGGEANLEKAELSLRGLSIFVNNQISRPNRKMVIWVGPGWPILLESDIYNARTHQLNFNGLASITNGLRQSRTLLCSAGGGTEFNVHDYLAPPKSVIETLPADLALQVFAIHSGGQTLDPGNGSRFDDLIHSCLSELGPFYRIGYDAPSSRPNEYHALQLHVAQPGLRVMTIAGYYAEP